MSKRDHIGDDGNLILPGIEIPSSSVRRSGQPVIQIHRAFPPPPLGSEGAITSEAGFESLGVIAVRVMATWKLPRMSLGPIRERSDGPQLPSPQRREED